MDTSDEWIVQRTGIKQRHYCPDGVGASDLAFEASKAAIENAGLLASDIDYILFNTMTPDHLFPGSGPLWVQSWDWRAYQPSICVLSVRQ